MLVGIQVIVIVILVFILVALFFDEEHKRKSNVPTGKLTQLWDGAERRRFVRVDVNVPIKYKRSKGEKGNVKIVNAKNLGVGGLCVTVNEKLNPHDSIILEICIPTASGSMPVTARGEVIWLDEDVKQDSKEKVRLFTAGIEFKEVASKDRERLIKFINDFKRVRNGG